MNSDRSNTAVATLEKLSSADGFWNIIGGSAQIGKIYMVDLDTIRTGKFINEPTGKAFVCEIVDVMEDDGEWQYFPTELLKIER